MFGAPLEIAPIFLDELADRLLWRVELGRHEAGMIVGDRALVARDADRIFDARGGGVRDPSLRLLVLAAAVELAGLPPGDLAQRLEPVGLGPQHAAGAADICGGVRPDAAALVLVPSHLLPFERLLGRAVRTRDEGLALIAFLVGVVDRAL